MTKLGNNFRYIPHMGAYTKLTLPEAESILNFYGLNQITSLIPMAHGISNSNYLVEVDEKRVILKISNDKNVDQLKEEQKILSVIENSGFKNIVNSLPLKSGEHVYESDDYYGVVYPFIQGIVPEIDGRTSFQMGKYLGMLHSKTASIETSGIRYFDEVGFGVDRIISYVKSPASLEKFKEYFYEIGEENFSAFKDLILPQGIIHGDLYFDNTLRNENDELILLDFEQSGIGEYLLDLGISISGTCLDLDGNISVELIQQFAKGYQEERSLSKTELEYIDMAIIAGLFSIALWRIDRFINKKISSSKDDSYIELLERALKFKESL